MKVLFSTGRPAHAVLPANLLARRGHTVTIYSAAPRSRFQQLSQEVGMRWVPQFVTTFHFLSGIQLPRPLQRRDTVLYDKLVAARLRAVGNCDIFWGWASGALESGRTARRTGAKFVLDRACPHVDAQQELVRTESERLGVPYPAEPQWFRERQLAEYDEADVIVVPSRYSRQSFPQPLQAKAVIAPLFGRVPAAQAQALDGRLRANDAFTFGTVGGQPLRKGFLYLLQAWEKLRLPSSKLLIRTDADLNRFPTLRNLLRRLPNVEIVGYVKDMEDFYLRCDAFVLPSVDDGFGMALLEAMSHGLPSIATNRCGATEIFETSRDLLVIPPQDAHALAEAMEKIFTSAELRRQLRENALQALGPIQGDGSFQRYSEALDLLLSCAGAPFNPSR